jgi:hypothetical protein
MFRCNHHHQGAYYSCFLKLQLLKEPSKIHRCVVMWMHILVGPCWCVYVVLQLENICYFRRISVCKMGTFFGQVRGLRTEFLFGICPCFKRSCFLDM